MLNAVREALESGGYHPRTFSHATELIEQIDPDDTGCVVTDLQMPGMNGMELQQALISKDSSLSLIMLTGYADVSVAVEVMRRGAVTLLEKPFKVQRLKEEVRRAVDQSQRFHSEKKRVRDAREAIESLTSEELAVLDCASRGKPNKAIGYELALSGRTVDRRRQSGLRKLNVDSISEFAVIRATAEDKRGVLDQRPR
ncbi:MAG: response regulator transcription factor [Pirellulaceae bacterium]|nr:response regulator transcription factor [Pirellulaceae bacterium]